MIINVARLGEDVERFQGEEPPSILELGEESDIRADKPVVYDLTACLAGGSVVVRGTVKTEISFACVRCAEYTPILVCDPSFLRAIEVTGEDNESVDLTDDIRESIILAFPTKPLCNTRCKGLCAGCGANLNREKCRCPPRTADDRWSTLDGMKF